MNNPLKILGFLIVALPVLGIAKPTDPWISYPTSNVNEYGVYHFRKSFEIKEIPDSLVIQISADNRYQLFVNGNLVSYGPAKGDLKTYKYDVVDLAPYLNSGENIIAAMVVNFGENKPMAFVTYQTAFLLRAGNENFDFLNSSDRWLVYKNPAYDPITYNELFKVRWVYGYYACGPGDELFADKYPWGWELNEFDDSLWVNAEVLEFQQSPWNLVPRNIAMMDSFDEYPKSLRKVSGMETPALMTDGQPIVIPANSRVEILLDFENFTMGYPELMVDDGKAARIQINYAEALYRDINIKGHRDSVNNLTMYGVFDIYHADGARRTFRPLWKRAFRYVQFNIETKAEPLTIRAYKNVFSGYPYEDPATFTSDDIVLNEIFSAGFQTFRMCSAETYYDTPYYEQLSYGGDNRPISAISTFNSTDDRLFREVMRLYPQSVNGETGLFHSAYPSRFGFDMGSWSMAWIQSLRDYYEIRGDVAYIKQFSSSIEGVLIYYADHMDESIDLLGPIRNQNFMDWSITKGSIPRIGPEPLVHSAMLSLYYAHTLDCAVAIFRATGELGKAAKWMALSDRIKKAAFDVCWNNELGLFSDFPDGESFSQHTNIFAILTDAVPADQQEKLILTILESNVFEEYASSYFSFFLFKAMQKVNREDLFLENLDFWKDFLDRGFKTFGETGFESHDRSDCHAWSAHPNFYLLNITAGIKSNSIGFTSVKISPELGYINKLQAQIPHVKGRIAVNYEKKKGKLLVKISLPEELDGIWEFGNDKRSLNAGINEFTVKL